MGNVIVAKREALSGAAAVVEPVPKTNILVNSALLKAPNK
jgi:hypothetical protein